MQINFYYRTNINDDAYRPFPRLLIGSDTENTNKLGRANEGPVTWQNYNDISKFVSKFQISYLCISNFMEKEERTRSMRLVNLNIQKSSTRKYTASTRK